MSTAPLHDLPPPPPGLVARRLLAVPWRHAGLIGAFALAGALVAMASTRPGAAVPRASATHRVAVAAPRHVQPIGDAPVAGVALRLDAEPGAASVAGVVPGAGNPGVAGVGAVTEVADASPRALPARLGAAAWTTLAPLRLDKHGMADAIDAALRTAPPAAGRPAPGEDTGGPRPGAVFAGLVAGLLLGLLAAARRELGGQRLRSAREARWALGAPVLGTIPTLSAKARGALVQPPPAA